MMMDMPGFDFVWGYPVWTLLQLGRNEEVLAEPMPPAGYPWLEGTTHVARAIALVRLKRLPEAEQEMAAVAAASRQVGADALEGLNPASRTYSLALALAQGVLLHAKGHIAEAELQLRGAVALEASLRYDEPPDWYTPASHFLGDFLLATGKPADAQEVYEEDLKRFPENGWALAGLARSLRAQKKEKEAAGVEARHAKAWAQADIPTK
jgi:hypothetical protein